MFTYDVPTARLLRHRVLPSNRTARISRGDNVVTITLCYDIPCYEAVRTQNSNHREIDRSLPNVIAIRAGESLENSVANIMDRVLLETNYSSEESWTLQSRCQ